MDDQGVIAWLDRESGCVEVFIGEESSFIFPELENKSQKSFSSLFETSS